MRNPAHVLPFVALTFFSWGIYGPTLHVGQGLLSASDGLGILRPFLWVGLGYFLTAVLFPLAVLFSKGEIGRWSIHGAVWSFLAGLLDAAGALGIVLAFQFRGNPIYVMPLVFGFAPVIRTLLIMLLTGTYQQATRKFYVAILVVMLGAAGVLATQPVAVKQATPITLADNEKLVPATVDGQQVIRRIRKETVPVTDDDGNPILDEAGRPATREQELISEYSRDSKEGRAWFREYSERTAPRLPWVALSIALAAACWGSYGPVLHRGQQQMEGSKLRPLMCVGLAYFTVAVVATYLLLELSPEPDTFKTRSLGGLSWSLLAGILGATGALGIIYAFNNGGEPKFVMPLIFGLAPVVNTFTSIFAENLFGQVASLFFFCLLMVIAGAVGVLVFSPRLQNQPAAARTSEAAAAPGS